MSDHTGLLRAIEEDPDDDTPRLILADWYEDNGDPERAEFMHLQLSRSALEGDPARRDWHLGWSLADLHRSGRWKEFVRECRRHDDGTLPVGIPPGPRELALLNANRERWISGMPDGVKFDRGLPERVELTIFTYLDHADALCRHSPVLSVALTAFVAWDDEDDAAEQEYVTRLAAHPSLSRWIDLDFIGRPSSDSYQRILTSPHLTNLRRLVAAHTHSGNDVGVIVEKEHAPRFHRLRWLDVFDDGSWSSNRPGDTELINLVTCPYLTNLEYLNFGGNRAGDAGVEALATSTFMSRLRSLNLSGNAVGMSGYRALGGSQTLANLRHLDLSFCSNPPLGDEGLAQLLGGRLFKRLRYLAINGSGVSAAGIAQLARTEAASDLRSLTLSVTGAGVEALAASPYLSGLRRLVLLSVVDDASADQLARSASLGGLDELRLNGRGLSEEGKAVLRQRFRTALTLCE